MSKRLSAAFLILVLLGAGLVGCDPGKPCSDPLGCVELERGQYVTIGVAVPLTGPDRTSGEAALAAVQAAAEQQKGIAGHPLRIQKTDFDCSADASQTASERLTGEATLSGVIAAGCLLDQPTVQNVFDQAGIAVLTQAETQPKALPPAAVMSLSPAQGKWQNPRIDSAFAKQAFGLFVTAIVKVATHSQDGSLRIPRQALQIELSKMVQTPG